jgi:hypothetical protein
MKRPTSILAALLLATLLASSNARATPATSTDASSWQRVTAHINGVFSPRGYFNLLVGLYSLPTLQRAQFNLGSSNIVLDFPPGTPPITGHEIQQIEKRAGYRPGPVVVERIAPANFSETGPGWTTIKHPQSKNRFARWAQQNF